MKTLLKSLLLGTAALFLTSCTSFDPSTESLMQPPRLTPIQSQLNDALIETAGTSADGIKLKYPREGKHRSAFVFHDLDGDGSDEAVAFYQADTKGTKAWISVLDEQDGRWRSVFEYPGLASNVDFVSFANITDTSKNNLVVGWYNDRSIERNITVFQYDNLTLKEIFPDNYRSYLEYAITDMDNDRLDEVIILNVNRNSKYYADLISWDGSSLDVATGGVTLNSDIQGFAQVKTGMLNRYSSALFIDELTNDEKLTTEILFVENGELSTLQAQDQYVDINLLTERSSGVLCQDVNNDGIIEIPTSSALPGHNSSDEDPVYLTQFNQFIDGDLEPVMSAYVNMKQGYMLQAPPDWVGNVSLTVQSQTGEWQFYEYSKEKDLTENILLRIRVYSQNDYHDKFENFILLEQKGLFEYYGCIPQNNSSYAISQTELEQLFHLL
ncbi:MAG: hypothetical protein IKV41_07440 [Oscillospiraceae bacterium]|nr:hypothetical protein [Oscillospiraceae bacterium]